MSVPNVEGYTIVGKIGSGTYSTVYKAFKKVGCREVVAIKCVEKAKLSGSAADNMVTEIMLLKKLKHQFIVEMKDFLWDDRNIYIIMEYCNGGDLSCFIRKRRRLPEAVCRKFLQQLALALKFMRSHNVCHMDLKPQNLLLTTNPCLTLKVGDFGFAQHLSPDTFMSSLRGSPLYMAPEILLQQHYDYRVDLWSVGVIMYECLFGRAPYSSNSFSELAEKIKARAKIEIPQGSAISSDCRDLLTRLLQHQPDKRIDYEEFFDHPFLDLEHYPSPESFQRAVDLIKQAVQSDAEGLHVEALCHYCDALRFFVPLVTAEPDVKKKAALRARVHDYIKRAEELKRLVYKEENPGSSEASCSQTKISSDNSELYRLCAPTPSLITALEIGTAAQQYLAEGQYGIALEKFQSCLGLLIPLLPLEPKGRRRDLLYQQVQIWMSQAENTKSLIMMAEMDESDTPESREVCVIS
ncbi:serine/threonine-protein kinase ULK3 isoform X2 [Bacillus rossius redtenbacheri]|uniref:serine/threonine-protein kinase ULK3 isoform X2 n=1 Tax=Bacillus rossius redtenbacheri TaxID=93214 RepID=UPI002FDD57B0